MMIKFISRLWLRTTELSEVVWCESNLPKNNMVGNTVQEKRNATEKQLAIFTLCFLLPRYYDIYIVIHSKILLINLFHK